MSKGPTFSHSFSAFGQEQWSISGNRGIYFPPMKRVWAVVADLWTQQLVSYVASCAAVFAFASPQDRIRFALLGSGCFLGAAGMRGASHLFHHYSEGALPASALKTYWKTAEHIAYIVSQLFLTVFYVATLSRVIHELGRALSAIVLFRNPNPIIHVGLTTSSTDIQLQGLSATGEELGWAGALTLLRVSGPLAKLIFDCSLVKTAYDNTKEKGNADLVFQAYARVFLSSALTAAAAVGSLWEFENKKNDFVQLQELTGIHPIAVAIAAFAIPYLYEIFVLRQFDYLYEQYGTRNLKSKTPTTK